MPNSAQSAFPALPNHRVEQENTQYELPAPVSNESRPPIMALLTVGYRRRTHRARRITWSHCNFTQAAADVVSVQSVERLVPVLGLKGLADAIATLWRHAYAATRLQSTDVATPPIPREPRGSISGLIGRSPLAVVDPFLFGGGKKSRYGAKLKADGGVKTCIRTRGDGSRIPLDSAVDRDTARRVLLLQKIV